jgi:hypothetical protein
MGCDLVAVNPHPDLGATGFCNLVAEGPDRDKLIVTVKNQGTVDASPSSTTIVEFLPSGSVSRLTPVLRAGESVELAPIALPASCSDPDCGFTITVDAKNQLSEDDEGNNLVNGLCTD